MYKRVKDALYVILWFLHFLSIYSGAGLQQGRILHGGAVAAQPTQPPLPPKEWRHQIHHGRVSFCCCFFIVI